MTTTATVLSQAWQFHQAGNLSQAETLYRQVLDAEPQHADALYLLGLVYQAQGRLPEAISLFQQLLRLKPDLAEVHNSLGVLHASQGQWSEALTCYEEAARLKPEYAEAFNNLGFVRACQGEWDQALAAYHRALALKPQFPETLSNLGILHFQQRRVDEAIECFQEAVALRPQEAQFHSNLGNALFAQGKSSEAIECYRQALSLRPNDARTLSSLGNVYRTLRQWDQAVHCLKSSLSYNANDPATYRIVGQVFHELGKYPEALKCYQQVLALSPDDVEARILSRALSGASLTQLPTGYLANMYDTLAPHFEKDLVQRRGYRSPELLQEALAPAPPPRSLDILDLGCGTGLCGVQFRGWARTLIGVDLSPQMLVKARERHIYDELIQGDLLAALSDVEGKFDLVLASDVLIYLGDLEPVTRAVHKALRPGGRFAFTVELLEGVEDYRLLPVVNFAHSRAYLQNLAVKTQMQEVSSTPVEFPREGGHKVAGLVVVFSRPRG